MAGQITLTLVLLYLMAGLITASLAVLCVILMQILTPDGFKRWEADKPIKNLHYLPQLIIIGVFLWPTVWASVFKKGNK